MTRESVLVKTMVELADSLVDDFDIVESADDIDRALRRGARHRRLGHHARRTRGRAASHDLVQRCDACRRTVRAPIPGRPVPGLLPVWQTRRQSGPRRAQRALAPLRAGRRGRRVPRRRRHPDASARHGDRRPQPFPHRGRITERRRCRRRPGPGRRRHHRHLAAPQRQRSRCGQRPTPDRARQSRSSSNKPRAWSPHARACPWIKHSPGSDPTLATTTNAWPMSRATSSRAPSTPARWRHPITENRGATHELSGPCSGMPQRQPVRIASVTCGTPPWLDRWLVSDDGGAERPPAGDFDATPLQ